MGCSAYLQTHKHGNDAIIHNLQAHLMFFLDKTPKQSDYQPEHKHLWATLKNLRYTISLKLFLLSKLFLIPPSRLTGHRCILIFVWADGACAFAWSWSGRSAMASERPQQSLSLATAGRRRHSGSCRRTLQRGQLTCPPAQCSVTSGLPASGSEWPPGKRMSKLDQAFSLFFWRKKMKFGRRSLIKLDFLGTFVTQFD